MKTHIRLKNSEILELYKNGATYKEIVAKGASNSQISAVVKGLRSNSQATKMAWARGRLRLKSSDQMSLLAKKACLASKKFWTKPEQEFRKILNSCGYGVKFPNNLRTIINENNDNKATICYQYPIQRYLCDFVDIKNKIIYRINGDYWHANPLLYNKPEALTKPQIHNIKQDRLAKLYFIKRGWSVVDIWESEIKWNVDLVRSKIRAIREAVNPTPLRGVDPQFESGIAHSDWEQLVKRLWFKPSKPNKIYERRICQCGKEFLIRNSRDKKRKNNCSRKCYNIYSRKVARPTYEQLLLDTTISNRHAARKYGVSDKTIAKWIKQYL